MYKPNMTLDEANQIVDISEQILNTMSLHYGYRSSELKGYSRIDVANASLLTVAQVYKSLGKAAKDSIEVKNLINALGVSTQLIATKAVPDGDIEKLENQSDVLAIMGLANKWSLVNLKGEKNVGDSYLEESRSYFMNMETPESFAEFCYSICHLSKNSYYSKVYSRIGIRSSYEAKIPEVENEPLDIEESPSNVQLVKGTKQNGNYVILFLMVSLCGALLTIYLMNRPAILEKKNLLMVERLEKQEKERALSIKVASYKKEINEFLTKKSAQDLSRFISFDRSKPTCNISSFNEASYVIYVKTDNITLTDTSGIDVDYKKSYQLFTQLNRTINDDLLDQEHIVVINKETFYFPEEYALNPLKAIRDATFTYTYNRISLDQDKKVCNLISKSLDKMIR